MVWKTCLKKFKKSWTLWFCLLVPLIFLPLPLVHQNSVARCGYCVIVMAVFWITEVIPLAITSLFPIFLFPLFGILTTKEVCSVYMQNTLMLFLSSLVIAVAVQRWNLHKRIALRTLTIVGPEPHWLLLGVMFPTWFLSMWMSNTASTAMMMPIVTAILKQIEACTLGDPEDNDAKTKTVEKDESSEPTPNDNKLAEFEVVMSRTTMDINEKRRQFQKTAKTFALATAYSANIGGMATLTGTPTNVFFTGFVEELFDRKGGSNPINFANWLVVGVPVSIIIFLFVWGWLLLYSRGLRCLMCWKKDTTSYERVRLMLRREYNSLGPMSFAEIMVSINFVAIALLWVTRKPGFIPGWGALFHKGYVGDSCPAVFICALLFILPAYPLPWFKSKGQAGEKDNADDSPYKYEPILNWEIVNRNLAWGVLLLMGGGYGMALGCEKSGLSAWLADQLESMSSLPTWVIALVLTIVVAMATEVTSNTATVSLFAPIVGEFALRLGINPVYFMLPVAMACSLAFLLPVATPPNAIVFSSGYLQVKDMVLAGILVNIFSVLVVNLGLNTWITALYGLSSMPEGFNTTMPQEISHI